jgi:large subunit ribosomal protein L10
MALSREQKETVVAEVEKLLSDSKLTVLAQYAGLSVKDMQNLRREARENGTELKVVKNRLFRLAVSRVENLKDADLSEYSEQLVYAFNAEDEVAPAQVLAKFGKKNPALKMVAGLQADGAVLEADDIKALAALPSKNELIAQVLNTLSSPLNDIVNGLSGNLHGLLDGVEAKAS